MTTGGARAEVGLEHTGVSDGSLNRCDPAFGVECGYEGIDLRLIDGELTDRRMSTSDRPASTIEPSSRLPVRRSLIAEDLTVTTP